MRPFARRLLVMITLLTFSANPLALAAPDMLRINTPDQSKAKSGLEESLTSSDVASRVLGVVQAWFRENLLSSRCHLGTANDAVAERVVQAVVGANAVWTVQVYYAPRLVGRTHKRLSNDSVKRIQAIHAPGTSYFGLIDLNLSSYWF